MKWRRKKEKELRSRAWALWAKSACQQRARELTFVACGRRDRALFCSYFFLIVGSIAARTTIWIRHCAPPTPRARMHGPTAGRRYSHRRLHRGTCHERGSTATRDARCGTALLPPASSRGGAGLLVSWCSGQRAGEGAWCSWFLGDWVSEATEMARARAGGGGSCVIGALIGKRKRQWRALCFLVLRWGESAKRREVHCDGYCAGL